MIKKILSVVFCAAVLNMSAVTGLAASKNTDFEGKKRVLTQLGFSVGEYTDAAEPVKRADFTEALLKIMNASTVCEEKDVEFSDINGFHDKYGIMANAQKRGLIYGGTARPDDYITYNEACKMVMCMLGYGDYAEYKGGYPSGYIVLADEQKVLRGINMFGNANLVFRDMQTMLFNSIGADVMVPKTIGKTIEYEIKEGETILKLSHDIESGEGIVNGVKNKSLYDNVAYDEGTVLINGIKYNTDIEDISDFVGMNTLFYYDADSVEVLAICSVGNTSVKIDAEDVYAFSVTELKYDENGKEVTEKIASDAVILFNDVKVSKVNSALFENRQGEISLTDNNSDGKADVIFMDITEDFAVKIADASSKTIYDIYESQKSVCLKDNGEGNVSFTDEYGNVMFISELVRYDVVSVRRSEDGEIIKAVFSNREARGSVEAIEKSGRNMYVTIGGVRYRTTHAFAENEELKIGDTAVFGLTTLNKIATVNRDISSADLGLGYLINAKLKKGISGVCEYKVLTADNKIKVFESADKLFVDGEYLSKNDAYSYLTAGGKLESCVIKYLTDSAGKLTDIDTPSKGKNENANTLKRMFSSFVDSSGVPKSEEKLEWRRTTGIFGSKIATSGKTVIFRVPEEDNSDDEYYITSNTSFLVPNDKYSIEAYKSNEESHMAEAVVLKSSETAEQIPITNSIAVVTDTAKIVGSDGSLQEKIYYTDKSGASSAVVKDSGVLQNILELDGSGKVHTLAEGDVIRFAANDFGKITTVELIYGRAGDNFKYPDTFYNTEAPNSQLRISLNEIYSIYGGNMLVYKGSIPGSGTVLGYDKLESYPADRFAVIVYDSSERNNKVKNGKASDLIDYKTAGKGSKIILYTSYTTNGVIVVYK